jgi:hypothetical protein
MSIMQAIRAEADSADLFAMTQDDVVRMRAIARRQLFGRIEAQAQAPRPDVESALAESMTQAANLAGAPSMNETRQTEAAKKVLDVLNEPHTAKQIAAALRKSENGVMNTLRRLLDQHRVRVHGFSDTGGRLWVRTDGAYVENPAAAAKAAIAEKTRAAILSALEKPLCAGRVASKAGISRQYAMQLLLDMFRAGKITRTKGSGCKPAIYERVRA